MTLAVVLALRLAGGALDDPPATPGASPTAPADAPAPDGPAPTGGDPLADHHGSRHALALGGHGITFFSNEGSQYTFYSAAFGYVGSAGDRGPFLHAALLLPLQARQDGRVYPTADYYRNRSGFDLLVGWQWRWSLPRDVEAEVGPGAHATLLYLPGEPGYRDFSALPVGVGAGAVLRWATGGRRFSRPVTLGAAASVAYDWYDPLRADDLAHGFAFRLSILLGVGAPR